MKDAADYLATGVTPEELEQLRAEAVDVEPSESESNNPNETDWPDPIPLPNDLPPVEPFPLETMPDAFREWIADVSERMQCPPDFVAIPAILAAGSIIGRSIGIRPKQYDDWIVIPNLWGLTIGRPSVMKSPSAEEALRPVRAMQADAVRTYKVAAEKYAVELEVHKAEREAVRARIKKAAKESRNVQAVAEQFAEMTEPDAPVAVRYIVSDATTEKLGELLISSERGILQVRDELAGWLHSFEKPGRETDRAFYLEGWAGLASFTVDRISRGTLFIPALTLSVFGTIQPGKLRPIVYAAATGGTGDDGLLQRFSLVTWPDASPTFRNVDRYPDSSARQRYSELFRELAVMSAGEAGATPNQFEGPPTLCFSYEAQSVFDAWRESLEIRLRSDELHPALESHLAKFRKVVPALALILYLVDLVTGIESPGAVPLRQLERAIRLAGYFESHARRMYAAAESPGIGGARSLLKLLREGKLSDSFALRDVYRNGWSGLSTPELAAAAIAVMLDYGYVREATSRSTGRPSTTYSVHPAVYPQLNRKHAEPSLTKPTKGVLSVLSVSLPENFNLSGATDRERFIL